MRYWIYWNDLVQGPFEPGELASLRAFTADLPVCEEDREDWIPAAAVSELLPYFQAAVNSAMPVLVPPPPPPSEPPRIIPLQGEFLIETGNQQTLFDQNGSRHFAFRPAISDAPIESDIQLPPMTTPFRFMSPNVAPIPTPPPVEPYPEFLLKPRPIVPPIEPDVPSERELGILEPEEMVVLEPPATPPVIPPAIQALPMALPAPPEPMKLSAPPPVEIPAPPPVQELPRQIPRSIPVQRPVTPASPQPQPIQRPKVDIPDFTRRRPAPVEDEPTLDEKTALWPWIVGLSVVLAAGGGVWYMRTQRTLPPVIAPHAVVESPAPPPLVEPAQPVEVAAPPPPRKVTKKHVKKVAPKIVAEVKKSPPPEPIEMPKLAEPKAAMPGVTAPEPIPTPAPTPYTAPRADFRGRETEAIDIVMKKKIYDGKRTIGENARTILDELHEKELLHAADTGERLYQPDKITWSALHEEGTRYRVYLNFLAWQANGERTMVRSDQFAVDVEKKTVEPIDDVTRHEFYDIAAMLSHQTNPKAVDIQTMLDGVDALNRHKLKAVIMKSSKQKDEKKKIQTELQAAEDKLQRQVVYFRTKYAEKTLQNIAKAFDFTATLKGK